MISFSRVSKRYPGGFEALRDVSLAIQPGEMVFVTGHSGAGKSTLLKLMAAIERPTSGSVIVNGQNVGALRSRAIPFLRRNFGLIFQDHKLLFDRNVFDNVALPLSIRGYTPGEAARRVRAALDKVGLLGKERGHPVTLSGGEQQRLALARALARDPEVLFLDEPTASLDPASTKAVEDIVRSTAASGVKIVMASHDLGQARRLAGDIVFLVRGRVAEYAAAENFFTTPATPEASAFLRGDLVI